MKQRFIIIECAYEIFPPRKIHNFLGTDINKNESLLFENRKDAEEKIKELLKKEENNSKYYKLEIIYSN